MSSGEWWFKPEDFKHEKFDSLSPQAREAVMATLQFACERANARLKAEREKAPVVYAHQDFPPIFGTVWTLEIAQGAQKALGLTITHRARLMDIEEIK